MRSEIENLFAGEGLRGVLVALDQLQRAGHQDPPRVIARQRLGGGHHAASGESSSRGPVSRTTTA